MAVNYTNPGWSNGVAPALDEDNLNDISNALENLAAASNAMETTLSGYGALQSQVAQNTSDISGMKSTVLVQNNISVAVSDWIVDTAYQTDGFFFRADVPFSGITSAYTPIVCFELPDALSGNFGPASISGANIVKIWAKTLPSAAMNIASIVALKGMTV